MNSTSMLNSQNIEDNFTIFDMFRTYLVVVTFQHVLTANRQDISN